MKNISTSSILPPAGGPQSSISQRGFAMPMVLTFIVLLGVVGTALVQNSVQTNGSAVLHSKVQISQIASKAAINYAEEQY